MKDQKLEKVLSQESVEELNEVKLKGKRLMAWRLSIFFTLVFTGIIIFVWDDAHALITYFAGIFVMVIGMVYLYITRNPIPLFVFYAFAGSIVAQLSSWFVPETLHYSDLNWMLICTVLAFIGISSFIGFVLGALNLIGIAYYVFLCHNDHIEYVGISTTPELIGFYAEIVLGFVILAHLMYEFNKYQQLWQSALIKTTGTLSEQNEIILKKNTENVVLLKEIHHRVKNNLQIIVSLLRLHKNELKTEESQQQFQEAINRVMVMSNIHKNLYQQENLTQIELSEYLYELSMELKMLYSSEKEIEIHVDCKDIALDLKTIIPVGLLSNELITNSLKHAFESIEKGKIHINIIGKGNEFKLIYSDNGKWLEKDGISGFGQELIQIFTDQLNGDFKRESTPEGTRYEFQLQKAD